MFFNFVKITFIQKLRSKNNKNGMLIVLFVRKENTKVETKDLEFSSSKIIFKLGHLVPTLNNPHNMCQ